MSGWDSATVDDGLGDDEDLRTDVFVVGGKREPVLGVVTAHSDVPLLLEFGAAFAARLRADRHSGGVRLHLPDGAR